MPVHDRSRFFLLFLIDKFQSFSYHVLIPVLRVTASRQVFAAQESHQVRSEVTDIQAALRTAGRPNRMAMRAGLLGLAIGVLFYFTGRPKGATYLQNAVPNIDRLFPYIPNLLGEVTGSFPSFLHPFCFSLIGMGLISQTRRSRILACSIFLLVNLFFEMGQRYKELAVGLLPHWVDAIPVLMNMRPYFLKGTFSTADVSAAFLGSATAFLVAEIIANHEKEGSRT